MEPAPPRRVAVTHQIGDWSGLREELAPRLYVCRVDRDSPSPTAGLLDRRIQASAIPAADGETGASVKRGVWPFQTRYPCWLRLPPHGVRSFLRWSSVVFHLGTGRFDITLHGAEVLWRMQHQRRLRFIAQSAIRSVFEQS